MSRPQSPENGPANSLRAANTIGHLFEHTDNRPAMAAAPVRAAVTSETPIKDLSRGTNGMAYEGSADRGLDSAPAGIRSMRPQTQIWIAIPTARGLAGSHHAALPTIAL
jgi:hypothetical protein